MVRQLLVLCIGVMTVLAAKAQDPQFSQFYAAPMYLNPGFTGLTTQDRVSANYRHQWPSIPGAFVTYNFAYDRNLDLLNSGIGFIVTHDQAGSGALSMTSVQGMYSYSFQVRRHVYIRPGIYAGMYRRAVDMERLTFGDQLLRGGSQFATSETWQGAPQTFFDFGVGGIVYGRHTWFGAAAHHINQPNQTLLGDQAPLPLKYSAHGGWRHSLKRRTQGRRTLSTDIVFAFNYKAQNQFDQLDVGFYYEPEPLVFGVWYRGIPVLKAYEPGYGNNDALVFMVGYWYEKFKIAYSYDATISRLVSNTAGSHEISISYEWADPRKQLARRRKPAPCAKF